MKNKRGFVKIVEAFVAVMLVAGVLLFVVSRNSSVLSNKQSKIDDVEKSVLEEIAQREDYRDIILSVDDQSELTSSSAGKFGEIWTTVRTRVPESLDFRIKVCQLEQICPLDNYPQKNVYTRAVAITTNITTYHPKQFKIWIWEK